LVTPLLDHELTLPVQQPRSEAPDAALVPADEPWRLAEPTQARLESIIVGSLSAQRRL